MKFIGKTTDHHKTSSGQKVHRFQGRKKYALAFLNAQQHNVVYKIECQSIHSVVDKQNYVQKSRLKNIFPK